MNHLVMSVWIKNICFKYECFDIVLLVELHCEITTSSLCWL